MKQYISSVVILLAALANVAGAQVTAGGGVNGAQYTKSQLKQLVREAHTPEQYAALATYYETRQGSYVKQAAEEKREWVRRGQNVVSIAAKYPRPVDSAQYLYEYYDQMATESGQMAERYRQLSGAGTSGVAK
jgi:hypothetical protein